MSLGEQIQAAEERFQDAFQEKLDLYYAREGQAQEDFLSFIYPSEEEG